MHAAAVVEQLDVVKDSRLGLLTSCKVAVMDQLVFQFEKKLSAIALSYALFRPLIEARNCASSIIARYEAVRYSTPRSVW